jgi:ribosome maturation factor RimP
MIEKTYIQELADEGLKDTDKFTVDVNVKGGSVITVLIDGDTGVTIDNCIRLSKFIESKLDRDTEDFELRVSSSGADKPLVMKRQYKKNMGRELNVSLSDGTLVSGMLENVDDDKITIRTKGDKKKGGKPQDINIDFENIKEASVILSFK